SKVLSVLPSPCMNRFIPPPSINNVHCIDRAEINKFPFLHSLGQKRPHEVSTIRHQTGFRTSKPALRAIRP
ncbi:MAG: hypothetical protein KBF54_06630, partial [Rhizobiales bacterium]|nr:hypothetical protein [Hyphomicrobiales bacterium]